MRIKKLEINKLFDRFNYSLSFDENEKVFMIHGYNGTGKTQILRIIEILCAKRFSENDLKNLNCHSVQLTYLDNSFLKISNTDKETNLYFSKEGKETTKKLLSRTDEDIKNEETILEKSLLSLSTAFLNKNRENPFVTYLPPLEGMIGVANSSQGWKHGSEFEVLYSNIVA